jgi:Beta-propeller repeat/Bacterial Ig-like domain
MKKMVRLLFCSLPIFVLAACGGGGGSSSTPVPGSAPAVLSVTPFDGATGLAASSTAVKVTFSKAMDPATITASTAIIPGSPPTGNGTFTVSYVANVTSTTAFGNFTTVTNKTFNVPGTVTADATNKIFTFTPTSSLAAVDPITGFPLHTPRTFKVTIKGGAGGVKEAGGTPLTLDKNSFFTIWAGTQQTTSSSLYNDKAYGVGADSGGNVYLAGLTYGSLGKGPSGLGINSGEGNTADILLSKYDSNGALQWNQQLGSQFEDQAYGFTVDSSSGTPQLVAVGYTDGTLPYSAKTNPDPSGATHNYFVAKFIEGNSQPWTVTQAGNAVNSVAYAVSTDINGNIYVAGETHGNLPTPVTSTTPAGLTTTYQGGADIFVAKYDKSLNLVWTKVIGSAGNDRATGIAVDTNSGDPNHPNVYITGWTDGSLFGTNKGGRDIFVAKLDNNGTLLGSGNFQPVQYGTAGDDHANAIAVDPSGFVTVVGGTTGSLFGTNQGGDDLFVVAFDPLGNIRWQQQIGTSADDEAFGVTSDALGSVYVTGSTTGSLFGTNQGGTDSFAIKYDKAGNKIWSSQLGSAQSDVGTAAAVFVGPNGTPQDPTGYLFLAGYTYGDLDTNFNQSGGKTSGLYNTSDMFLAKYNTATGLKY